MTPAADPAAASVAVLTPSGADASLAVRFMGGHGISAYVCAHMEDVVGAIASGVGALLIAEEALGRQERELLLEALSTQPKWSDVPLVLLLTAGELTGGLNPSVRAIVQRGNVTLLERPVRVATLTAALEAALRGRARQFEMRDAVALRAQSEEDVRGSEERLRAAVEAAPYPLMVHADDGSVIHLSRTWTALTGYRPAELTSVAAWAERAYDHRSEPARELTRAGTIPADTDTWEREVRTASGGQRLWSFHSADLGLMRDGRALRLIAAVDVTETRRLVENERSLRQEAQDANMAKMQFLATMSHELRTPLNAIGGHVQLMELGILGPVTEKQTEALGRVRRAEAHLLGLINDVLNFAKIEAGRVTFNLEPVSLATLFDGMDALIEPQVKSKGLSYTRLNQCDSICILADLEKARQVILNLLSNSVKFTNAGGRIEVDCLLDERMALIKVTDTGIGIAPEVLQSMFEPFVQVRQQYDATNEGTGLGLAISRDLAQAMDGDLEAESTPGNGSTFTFSLPLAHR
ncbi:MAG: ATP-binding protein [Gemmatimonadota bacterium]|nr:ATP-binding protein [Gemmatimonadota bacterium]